MKRRKPSKRERTMQCIAKCSEALSGYYRGDGVMVADIQLVLGVLFALHVQQGRGLRLFTDDQR